MTDRGDEGSVTHAELLDLWRELRYFRVDVGNGIDRVRSSVLVAVLAALPEADRSRLVAVASRGRLPPHRAPRVRVAPRHAAMFVERLVELERVGRQHPTLQRATRAGIEAALGELSLAGVALVKPHLSRRWQ